jgi:hypothetical protein
MISTDNLKTHIEKIASLCILHRDIDTIYIDLEIIIYVVEYFYINWETYSKGDYSKSENEIIMFIILNYHFVKYEIMIKNADLENIIADIEKDKYLSSNYGLDAKRTIIFWIYDTFLSNKKSGIDFLKHFSDDQIIRMKFKSTQSNTRPYRNLK